MSAAWEPDDAADAWKQADGPTEETMKRYNHPPMGGAWVGFDYLVQNGIRIRFETAENCRLNWFVLNAEPFPSPAPAGPGYIAHGQAECFGEAVAKAGD